MFWSFCILSPIFFTKIFKFFFFKIDKMHWDEPFSEGLAGMRIKQLILCGQIFTKEDKEKIFKSCKLWESILLWCRFKFVQINMILRGKVFSHNVVGGGVFLNRKIKRILWKLSTQITETYIKAQVCRLKFDQIMIK